MPMKNPPHPGDFIWTEIIEPKPASVRSKSMCDVFTRQLPFTREEISTRAGASRSTCRHKRGRT